MKLSKYIAFLLILCSISISANSQYYRTIIVGKSSTKKISYRTKKIEESSYLKPKLEIIDYSFIDENSNGVLEQDESANIEIQLLNKGDGTARDVYLGVELLSREIEGIEYKKELFIGNIYTEITREIIIPLKGKSYLNTGIAHFRIEVNERFGYIPNPVNIKIGTNDYIQPGITIKEAMFSTDKGGKVQLSYPVYLRLFIENTSPKDIKNLEVDIYFDNQGCVLLEDNKFIISSLGSYESMIKEVVFTTKKNYPYDIIPIKFHFHDKYKMYSEIKSVFLDLNQVVASRTSPEEDKNLIESTKFLVADVDTGIPYDSIRYPNRFALVIGNEDYTKHQPALKSESNVIYAKNDATIFRKYAINTLGIPKENVFLLINATYAEMKHEVERISKIIEKSGDRAELVFYYAGHGLPDENTHLPYLIPVDVSATNLHSAIKLSDIYKRFSETGAEMITLFIDACFTGGGRESGLLSARAFSVEPKFELLNGNMVVFLSSSGTQSSLPYHEKKHGIFTYFLLKKLMETRAYISYGELSDYLSKTVAIESLRINSKEQDPKVHISINVKDTWQDRSFKEPSTPSRKF